jgi:hypothetical protein
MSVRPGWRVANGSEIFGFCDGSPDPGRYKSYLRLKQFNSSQRTASA